MKISVTTTPQTLPKLFWGKRYAKFTEDKEILFYRFTIQNLWKTNIYIENWEDASIDQWYKLFPWNDVEIKTNNIHRISFISENQTNNEIRIITT